MYAAQPLCLDCAVWESQESWLALQTSSLLWGNMLGNDLKYGDAFCLFVLGQKQNKNQYLLLNFHPLQYFKCYYSRQQEP